MPIIGIEKFMGKLFQHSFLHRVQGILFHPVTALAWLLVIVLACLWIAKSLTSGRSFDTSIMALLPEDAQQQTAAEQIAKNHLNAVARDTLIFLVGHSDHDKAIEGASRFAKQLERSREFKQVQGKISDNEANRFRDFFHPYRYALLSNEDRQYIDAFDSTENALNVSETHPLVKNALARIYSPMASLVGASLLDDPLQTFFNWQLSAVPKTSFQLQDQWLTKRVDGKTFVLISVDLSENPFNMTYQKVVESVIENAEEELPVGSNLLRSGMLFHAAHGARQAQSEVSTIGLGSVAGIALMLLYFFRSFRYVALAFVPIATGCIFSLAVSLLIFSELHLITLAFGAGLVGVAIDYSLHFLCASKDAQTFNLSADKKCRAIFTIFPGITLGLISSAVAYAAQGISPFPGLRQMALFSVMGLFGAWMTVVCWLPRLPLPRHKDESLSASTKFIRSTTWMLNHWPNVSSNKTRWILLPIIVVSIYCVSQLSFDDDIRKLQTSPQSMLDEEVEVQRLAQSVNTSQYFVVSGNTVQQLLEREEQLRNALEPLLIDKAITDYHAVSKMVPSLSRQNKNISAAETFIYSEKGLAEKFSRSLGAAESFAEMKAGFERDKHQRITLEDWQASDIGELQDYLWIGQASESIENAPFYSIVALAGIRDQSSLQALRQLTALENGIQFVDSVDSITRVLQSNRQSLLQWLTIAYGIVCAILFARYRFQVWRIVAAPAIASLMALAIASVGGFVVNIFNLLALLLVLGIGLDASIFLRESRGNIHTWVAVTLAAITTFLAFGLLALSQTPVLHQFGITVLLGIIGVWLLAPCFIEKSERSYSVSKKNRL